MKFLVLAALFACACALPQRMVLPRLPASVISKGKFQLIPSNKIVGGTEVEPNSLPFQVSLQRKGLTGLYSQSCGGSILDENTILDAAHCVDGANIPNLRIVAGEHSLSVESGLEQNRLVTRVATHPRYNSATYEDDISLIFLDAPLDLSVPSAKAISLPPPTSELDPPAGTVVTCSGWGTTSSGGSISDVLRSVDIPVVSDADCDSAYGGLRTNKNEIKRNCLLRFKFLFLSSGTASSPSVFPSMMCAGDTANGGIDSCQGDSGGPLFTGTGETAVQHGIVSWGQGCALARFPGVYTQVSYFLDWIAAARG
ncbi:trypsin-1-like isoform X1 [Daphnia pulicaria]|uniref:trypsin-1-like isoform X1 n=1 Tax=Daphnia pulicaria TaxID=35523 RepID=UPI001EEBEEF8|nr:trypsin-1-like isoform X1 [Daphnia pulicaria]